MTTEFAGYRQAKSVRARRVTSYAILTLFAIIFIGPFLITVATSFKTDADAIAEPLRLIPDPFTLLAWKQLFGLEDIDVNIELLRWITNSVVVTVCITIGRVGLASMAGYALARLDFPGRRTIFAPDPRRDDGARRRAVDPPLPGAQGAPPAQQLPGHDPAADGRPRRHLPDEAELRADPALGGGGGGDRRRQRLADVALRRAADGPPGADRDHDPVDAERRGTSSRCSSSPPTTRSTRR